LVVENRNGPCKRVTQGFDSNRLNMLIAIIEKYLSKPMNYNDVYLNIVGGLKISGRELDLSIIASLLSSYNSKALDPNVVYIGEVGLTGEIRSVRNMEQRLKEVTLLKYDKVVTSKKLAEKYSAKYALNIVGLKSADELLDII